MFGRRDESFIRSAIADLVHRGPDGRGALLQQNYSLGHTRLTIVELSAAGAQPMRLWRYSDGTLSILPPGDRDVGASAECSIAFNGEIYNRSELEASLVKAGHSLDGGSDTEVLLRALHEFGDECLTKLAGMYAFAYWNEPRAEGMLARDPFGIKPLYYAQGDGSIYFASELRALSRFSAEIDPEGLQEFLIWGAVAAPATTRKGIRQLRPGEVLKWTKGGSKSVLNLPTGNAEYRSNEEWTFARAKQATREALQESVSRHLVSDVPVGVFLSGGVDSTAVLALVREALGPGHRIQTYSIGFDVDGFDESSIARRTAAHFGTEHHERILRREDVCDAVKEFIRCMDSPTIDGFNSWLVSEAAVAAGAKVALSGLGADELFGGYPSFKLGRYFSALHSLLGPMRPLAGRILSKARRGSRWQRLAVYLSGENSALAAFHAVRGLHTPVEARLEVERILGIDLGPGGQPISSERAGILNASAIATLETDRYLIPQLLGDSDVFSMCHGLELRVPFVDCRLARALALVPPAYRFRQGKALLKEAVPELPAWVLNQPKRGFRVPLDEWITEALPDFVDPGGRKEPWYRIWAREIAAHDARSLRAS